MSRYKSKDIRAIAYVPSVFFSYGSVVLPILYIYWAYYQAIKDLWFDWQLVVSVIFSTILIVNASIIIMKSQKI